MFETKKGVIKPIVYVGIIKNEKLLLVDYEKAPNPAKTGWWIPAPSLGFGEDPRKKAAEILSEMNLSGTDLELKDVESFVTPGGWHLLYHFTAQVLEDPKPSSNIKSFKWVTAQDLEGMSDMAHRNWEIQLGRSYLAKLTSK